ncbi:unnamed protein product [Ambrosiozyma monospora]|uniref:Unnamed protein product n=1 Tax=Ambrosiozyma monospora TaxID=43982 RepID=A0ACB5U8D2_AMBMO|nr:unnamed protein product [Ambrosiozyma monospora]
MNNISEINTFLKNTQDLNVRFDIRSTLIEESENILNAIVSLMTQWHDKFNGTFKMDCYLSEDSFYGSTVTKLIETISNSKSKTLRFYNTINDEYLCSIDALFQQSCSSLVDLFLGGIKILKLQNLPLLKRVV